MKMNNINTNVGLWLAMDTKNRFITINKAVNGVDYICPECGTTVRARALNSDCVSPHYYHLNNNNCVCTEAILQYWKENFINVGDSIYLKGRGNVTCIDIRTDFIFNTQYGNYKADIIIKTKDNNFVIFELSNNKSATDYKLLKELKYNVYKVDVKALVHTGLNKDYCIDLIYNHSLYKDQKQIYNEIQTIITKYKMNTKVSKGTHTIKYKNISLDRFMSYDLWNIIDKSKKIINNSPRDVKRFKELDKLLFANTWDKTIYFDLIKPIHTQLLKLIKLID